MPLVHCTVSCLHCRACAMSAMSIHGAHQIATEDHKVSRDQVTVGTVDVSMDSTFESLVEVLAGLSVSRSQREHIDQLTGKLRSGLAQQQICSKCGALTEPAYIPTPEADSRAADDKKGSSWLSFAEDGLPEMLSVPLPDMPKMPDALDVLPSLKKDEEDESQWRQPEDPVRDDAGAGGMLGLKNSMMHLDLPDVKMPDMVSDLKMPDLPTFSLLTTAAEEQPDASCTATSQSSSKQRGETASSAPDKQSVRSVVHMEEH